MLQNFFNDGYEEAFEAIESDVFAHNAGKETQNKINKRLEKKYILNKSKNHLLLNERIEN